MNQLQVTLNKMEVALDAIADAVIFVDEDRRVQWCNAAFARFVKRSHPTIIGSTLGDLLPLKQQGKPIALELYPDVRMRKGGYETTEYEFQQGDSTLVLEISGNCADQGDHSIVLVIRDISDRKQAEAALTETEAKFRTIIENVNDLVFSMNAKGEVLYVSPNVQEITGYTAAEVKNLSFEPFTHPDDVPKCREAIAQLVTTGQKQSGLEFRGRRKDGGWNWYSTNLALIKNTNSKHLIVGITRDITERKLAEEALKASEARLNTILNSTLASIERYRFDANGEREYEYCSAGCLQVWGYSPEEMVADKNLVPSRIHPEDWEVIFAEGVDAIYAERPFKFEYRYNHPDGNLRWISASLTSVRDEATDSWIVTVTSIDISDRKRAEAALAESEAKFRMIVENADVVLSITSQEGIIRYISPNVSKQMGWTPAELKGQSYLPLVHLDDIPKCLEVTNQLTATGEHPSAIELQYRTRHKDGSWRWLVNRATVSQDADGQPIFITVVQDITERKQAEEALIASEARLNTILNSALAAISRIRVDANRQWEYEYCSSGSIQLWGYAPEELMDNKNLLLSRIVPKDLEAIEQSFDDIFAERTSKHEYRYWHPDGNLRWIAVTINSVRSKADDCWIATVIATDISDRKRAEAALAESEAKFRMIVENADVVLAITTQEGVIRYVSPNVSKQTGWTSAELEGQSFAPFIHLDDIPKCLEVMHQLTATSENPSGIEYQYRARHKDGSWRWQNNNSSVSHDADGQPIFITVVQDITERRRAEEALKASEARLNTILNRALAIISRIRVYANREWEYEYCSSGSTQLWGYAPEELIADKNLFLSRIVPEDLEAIYEQAFDYFFTERTFEAEYRYNHPDGSLRWLSFNSTCVRDEVADCWIVTSISTDITARKQAEADLANSLSLLRTIFEAIQDGILAADGELKTIDYNQKFVDIWSMPPEYLTDKDPTRRLSYTLDQLTEPEQFLQRLKEIGANSEADSYDLLELKDGRIIERYTRPQWLGNKVVGRVASFRDITDRKRAEEALRASEARLNRVLNSALAVILRIRVYANREWEIEYCSAGCIQIWGYSPEELIADKNIFLSHFVSEDLDAIYGQAFDYFFTERTFEAEYRYNHPDGSLRWISFNTSSVRDEAADCWIATSISTDISDRKRAEEALKASEARLNTILSSALASIERVRVYANRNWVYEYISPGSIELWGYSAEETMAEKSLVTSRIHPEDWDVIYYQAIDAILAERPFQCEYRYNHPDGNLRWISLTVSSVRDRAADYWIATVIATDISDRKYLEEQLQQSQKLLDSIIENIPLSLFVKDVKNDFRYVIINKSSEKILGLSKETGLGLTDYERLPKQQADYFRNLDLKVIEQKTLVEIPELWFETESQENLLVRCWKLPLFDNKGNPTHLLTILEDITERWQKDQDLRLIVEGTALLRLSNHAC